MRYLVLVDLDYDPNGKHYTAGEEYGLDDWAPAHIENALRAEQIEERGEIEWRDR